MKEKTQNKSVRNAHILLAGYWIYKVLSGGNVLKTTLSVLGMENRSAVNDARRKKALEKKTLGKKTLGKKTPGQKALSSGAETAEAPSVYEKAPSVRGTAGTASARKAAKAVSGRSAAKKTAGTAAAGIVRSAAVQKAAKSILKSARVI